MEYANLTQLIADCITELAQVPGSGTQTYSEDNLALKLRNAYNSVCGEAWWPHLMRWSSHTLDASTGKVTTATKFPLTIRDFGDIRYVFVGTQQRPLSLLPEGFNPFALSGTSPRFIEQLNRLDEDTDSTTRFLFKVWPLEATGTLRVRARHVDEDLFTDPEVEIPVDRWALVYAACMLYVAADGNNPNELTSFQVRYKDRLDQCRAELNNLPIDLDTRQPFDNDTWQEYPYS